jgi:hypothetical protein
MLRLGRVLKPGFIRFFPKLAVYHIAHSLPLGSEGEVFPFTEDETRRYLESIQPYIKVNLDF